MSTTEIPKQPPKRARAGGLHGPWSWTGPRAFGVYLVIIGIVFSLVSIWQENKVNNDHARLKADEVCLAQWARSFTDRSATLTRIAALRTNADNNRQDAAADEQHAQAEFLSIINYAISHQPISTKKGKQLNHQLLVAGQKYLHANAAYEIADKNYKKYDSQYTLQSKLHPVPTPNLDCPNANLDIKKVLVVTTQTSTATATATMTKTQSPSTRVLTRPGGVVTITVPKGQPTPSSVVTVTVKPRVVRSTVTRTVTRPVPCPTRKICVTVPAIP